MTVTKKVKKKTESKTAKAVGAGAGNTSAAQYMVEDVDRFITPRGHGFAAEQMNHYWDKAHGHDAHMEGEGEARYIKNGYDRVVDGVEIQSKYCKTGSKCVGECFENGKFRYINSQGKPMQVEVPSDKYDDAVRAMEERIKRGQVPGITDPKQAKDIIRKGNFTYEQARNVARFGTVESITFDAAKGSVVAAYSFGISCAINFAVSTWNGKPRKEALKESAAVGLKIGGTAFVTTVLASQMERTAINSMLVGTTDQIVNIMGAKASAMLANAFRSGAPVYGAAAMKSASKLLRGNAVTGAITVAVLSTFDVADLFRGRISGKQLFKNVSRTAATVAGGTGGWMAGAAVGTAICPGIGTVVGGLLGSFAGGSAAGKVSSSVLNEMVEDDAVEMQRILEAEFQTLAVDYLVTRKEAEKICDRLSSMVDGNFLKNMFASASRHDFAKRKMEVLFEDIAKHRKKIILPTDEQMLQGLKDVLNVAADNQESIWGNKNKKVIGGKEMKNDENLDFLQGIKDVFNVAADNQESIWDNKNKKVIGGKEMKNDENLDLEREYNWYIQKVVDTGESQGMTTLVKAICEFAADFNGWDDDARHEALDVREKDNESIIDIDGGYPSVTVKRLRNNTYLISCEDVRDDEAYYRDMYGFIEDYIEKIASNKCPVCGEEIVGKGKFCANCGATL